jgi:hypothetical protein
VEGSGLFGDRFGAFAASTEVDGTVTDDAPGAQGMRDNQYEGVFIDDIVIGFAARGEMVTGSTQATDPPFSENTAQLDDEIDTGPYQLEIRQSSQYGRSEEAPQPTLALYDTFDVNDRLADGVTIVAQGGYLLKDGQTFSVSDGQRSVTFEFDDLTSDSQGVAAGNLAIEFDPSDSDVVIARRIRDAINGIAVALVLNAKPDAPHVDGVPETDVFVRVAGVAVPNGIGDGLCQGQLHRELIASAEVGRPHRRDEPPANRLPHPQIPVERFLADFVNRRGENPASLAEALISETNRICWLSSVHDVVFRYVGCPRRFQEDIPQRNHGQDQNPKFSGLFTIASAMARQSAWAISTRRRISTMVSTSCSRAAAANCPKSPAATRRSFVVMRAYLDLDEATARLRSVLSA